MSKSQRRKGNAQCANSSKAAELLHGNGIFTPILGLEGLQLPIIENEAVGGIMSEEFNTVRPELRIILKKLMKKDCSTKEKGIREILEILPTIEKSEIKALFSCFVPIYLKLITDSVSIIRALTNNVFLCLLQNLRKDSEGQILKTAIPFFLFSLSDAHGNSMRAAEQVLNECFANEKRKLLFQSFTKPTLNLALEIINCRHKLLNQSQNDETLEQRKSRLISQALVTLGRLMDENSEFSPILIENFSQPTIILSLMKMSNNIKIAAFTLLNRFIQINSDLFLDARISALILANLDNTDLALSRNAFECFLLLARNKRFKEICKFEKAVIPKFLSLVRKKLLHWNVLETLLFPSFIVICNELNEPSINKWICALLDSFFDGNLPSYLISSWSIAFVEIVQHCFVHYSNISDLETFLFKKVFNFFNYIIENSRNESVLIQLAEFIIFSCNIKLHSTNEYKSDLFLNILNKLPKSSLFISILLQKWDDKNFCVQLIKYSNISDEILVTALEKNLNFACEKIKNLDNLLVKRIKNLGEGSDKVKIELLKMLCNLVVENKIEQQCLNNLIEENNLQICNYFSHISPVILKQIYEINYLNNFNIILCFSRGILSEEFSTNKDEINRIISFVLEIESIYDEKGYLLCKQLVELFLASNLNYYSLILLNKLFTLKKIPNEIECALSIKLFDSIISENNSEYFQLIADFLCLLNVDQLSIINKFNAQLISETSNYEKTKSLALIVSKLHFLNFKLESFLPTIQNFKDLTNELERKFLLDILMEDSSFLYSFLSVRKNLFNSITNVPENPINLFNFLIQLAKQAFFYSELITHIGKNISEDLVVASHGYIWLSATFLAFFCSNTFSLEYKLLLDEYLSILIKFNFTEKSLISSIKLLLPKDEHDSPLEEICFPLSIIFALRKAITNEFFSIQTTETYKFIELNNFLKSTFIKFCPSLAFSLSLNFNTIDSQIPILLEGNNETIETNLNNLTINNETILLQRWIYEFERLVAVFTPNNRAEHFVTLSIFVERNEFSEWLFTLNDNDETKNAFSCAILRFCCKVVPYLAEVDGPIRDFINCGFITALQTCTDAIMSIHYKKKQNLSLLFVMGELCAKLFIIYENCLRINGNNTEYAEIKQEWNEFFSPSALNFLMCWILNIGYGGNYPSSFILQICRSIHFIDYMKISLSDCLLNIESDDVDLEDIGETFFANYPLNKRRLLTAAVKLLFTNCIELQLASARIIQSHILLMFEIENSQKQTLETLSNTSNINKGFSKGFDIVEDVVNEKSDNLTLISNNDSQQIPRLLSYFLQYNFLQQPYSTNQTPGASLIKRLLNNYDLNNNIILLLIWNAFIRFVSTLDTSMRVKFCESFTVKIIDQSLSLLFSKLPNPPCLGIMLKENNIDDLFTVDVDYFSIKTFDINKFVCNLYYRTLITVPALVRQWYISLPKNLALLINNPYISKYEIGCVGRSTKRGRLDVKVMPNVNEVSASYKMDDSTINLHIHLPEDFPLVLASIETQRKIVREDLHRKWLLQLETFLSHQNGSLLDGILQWKRNIDKHLEGVDDCTICMLTVSSTNYQLPRILCRQCKHKFHGDCLYKWFKTSSNTSCPLCRANFVYM